MSAWYDRACDGCGRAVAARVPAGVGRVLCIDCEPRDLPFTPAEGTGQSLTEAHAEIERLRRLLGEALDGWEGADQALGQCKGGDDDPRIAEIRREAGLT